MKGYDHHGDCANSPIGQKGALSYVLDHATKSISTPSYGSPRNGVNNGFNDDQSSDVPVEELEGVVADFEERDQWVVSCHEGYQNDEVPDSEIATSATQGCPCHVGLCLVVEHEAACAVDNVIADDQDRMEPRRKCPDADGFGQL